MSLNIEEICKKINRRKKLDKILVVLGLASLVIAMAFLFSPLFTPLTFETAATLYLVFIAIMLIVSSIDHILIKDTISYIEELQRRLG